MKKYIALFSLVALALAVGVTANAAKCSISGNAGDDYFATCAAHGTKTFVATNNSSVDFDTTTVNVANSGGNSITAGEDLEGATMVVGNADAATESAYDVGSADIIYEIEDSESDAAIEDNTELEDAVLVATANETSNEVVTNNNDVDATELDVTVGNTGLNSATAGEDGEDISMTVGSAKTSVKKSWFVGYSTIRRNATP